MKKYIYLAGPIAGLNFTEANDWRTYCQKKFEPGIVGISPLRCEPLEPGKLYAEDDSVIKMWSDPRAISCKNWLDTESSDLVLAYLPKEMNDRRRKYDKFGKTEQCICIYCKEIVNDIDVHLKGCKN